MLEIFKESIVNQYEAAFSTLKLCSDHCPPEAWDQPVHEHRFCQAVFHTLFFADVYLGPSLDGFEDQEFHRQHTDEFRGYEEWEDRKPLNSYSREFIDEYFEYCRAKMIAGVASETEASLAEPSGFPWLEINRAGVHVYNIRHIQHHAAQLVLRMRIDGVYDAPWVKSGWKS